MIPIPGWVRWSPWVFSVSLAFAQPIPSLPKEEPFSIALEDVHLEESQNGTFAVERVRQQLKTSSKISWQLRAPLGWKKWVNTLDKEQQLIVFRTFISTHMNAGVSTRFHLERSNGEFRMEYFSSMPGSLEEYVAAVDSPPEYNDWVFQKINESESGSPFFVLLFPLKQLEGKGTVARCSSLPRPVSMTRPTPAGTKTGYPYVANLPFRFQFLSIERDGVASFFLNCGRQRTGWQDFKIQLIPNAFILDGAATGMLFSGGKERTFGVVQFRIRPPEWVYAMLPFALVRGQVEERLKTVLTNLEDYRKQFTRVSTPVPAR